MQEYFEERNIIQRPKTGLYISFFWLLSLFQNRIIGLNTKCILKNKNNMNNVCWKGPDQSKRLMPLHKEQKGKKDILIEVRQG